MSRQKPNLKREILTLKGESFPMTFPSKGDIEKVKKATGKDEVKVEDLPKETVQNVIINSLAHFDPKDKRDVFMINQVASWAMAEPEEDGSFGELKEKLYGFLINDVLPYATVMQKKAPAEGQEKADDKSNGIYYGWVMAQVYEELGLIEE